MIGIEVEVDFAGEVVAEVGVEVVIEIVEVGVAVVVIEVDGEVVITELGREGKGVVCGS